MCFLSNLPPLVFGTSSMKVHRSGSQNRVTLSHRWFRNSWAVNDASALSAMHSGELDGSGFWPFDAVILVREPLPRPRLYRDSQHAALVVDEPDPLVADRRCYSTRNAQRDR
jgi:hypothetical protein